MGHFKPCEVKLGRLHIEAIRGCNNCNPWVLKREYSGRTSLQYVARSPATKVLTRKDNESLSSTRDHICLNHLIVEKLGKTKIQLCFIKWDLKQHVMCSVSILCLTIVWDNERRRYKDNIFHHWPIPRSAIDRKQALTIRVTHVVSKKLMTIPRIPERRADLYCR